MNAAETWTEPFPSIVAGTLPVPWLGRFRGPGEGPCLLLIDSAFPFSQVRRESDWPEGRERGRGNFSGHPWERGCPHQYCPENANTNPAKI